MKKILVFVNGTLYRNLYYKTKREAKGNYKIFKEKGILDPNTGLPIQGATFELI